MANFEMMAESVFEDAAKRRLVVWSLRAGMARIGRGGSEYY